MTMRSLFLAAAVLGTTAAAAFGQTADDVIAPPVLRASVTVSSDVVRIGDILDNAGPVAQIPIYRAPDLGTTGTLSVAQVLSVLRAHKVIGVDSKNVQEVTVTRPARTLEAKDIQNQVAQALEHRNGLGDAANLSLTFDRDVQTMQFDPSTNGPMLPASTRYDPRSGRFDVLFTISSDSASMTRLRFTGVAIETVEAAVLARSVDKGEVLKSSDVISERRPKAEVGNDVAARDRAVGMQSRRPLRVGQALRTADIAKPDLVVRDQPVTLIYESSGLYLTIRGKAVEGGTEGDVVNVLNLQSKRTIAGVVVGRGQVAVSAPSPREPDPVDTPVAAPEKMSAATAPVAVATNEREPGSRKAE